MTMNKKQISKKIQAEAQAKTDKYLAKGKDIGDIACPNWPEDHKAKMIQLRSGKTVTICPECGYEHIS